MKKVTPISKRKADQIRINLEEDVRSGIDNGLGGFRFIHEALPEINLSEVNPSVQLYGKHLSAPILISSMTGGTPEAETLNINLALGAQECRIAMGVGSQRAALETPDLSGTFDIRKIAPDIILFANLGAIQLNNGMDYDACQRAIDMIHADGLLLHLNPLQEALQTGGNTNFKGLAEKIERICQKISVPVIVKEVGWGISENTTKMLYECGVSAIDVAGAGGTSWSQVEMYSAPDEFSRQLAAVFKDWGISTAKSIINVKKIAPEMPIFASGGIKNGVEMAKCFALGATLAGSAGIFLSEAAISPERVVNIINLLRQQIKTTMFVTGSRDISELSKKLISVEQRK
ncbi:MAG: type 2 isopentenyl-diphosphate Delta-isomerase [Chloroflexi bacterium GWB2_49_20]|nr:MAG: type 2 isopentenyl-diphosphate Delta-isomerase [Chloroflexi bacterium GWB2_49_20]OGN78940.1 MAG: type 2 isopentenyl-diphosphate Delta-isomerase [Chloroflexi bacterium GWC2_49_37]OGN86299.1 MAG: type 2 isopentenyl-diphosphate Delta-isomerase [Chloroflexi bacterium GWD2_49_16]HBG74526.1 type 2 isopentenyl-diphosphate Delta-isomerase [Anaerolineae bacterium]